MDLALGGCWAACLDVGASEKAELPPELLMIENPIAEVGLITAEFLSSTCPCPSAETAKPPAPGPPPTTLVFTITCP